MAIGYHGWKTRKRNKLGLQLDRETTTLPASTYGALFTIAGGRIVLTSIIGEVTTVIQTQACNLKITSTPTVGTAVDIATNLAISAAPVQSLYGIGAYVAAMTGGTGAANISSAQGIVIPAGTLGITTSATNTGSIKWSITYIPLDDDAYVTVA